MAQQQPAALFEESSQGAVSVVTAFVFVLSIVLAFGGIVLASFGFTAFGDEAGHPSMFLFASGLALSVIGFILPFTLLPATGK
ncbi:hypothetical protein BMH32_07535 [Leucobacter sp. OLJS4]|uniref:hypothetical protein n=1 Tax=unclassified Leucobacter TaxID=2621730 RepID=UPI000C195E51|nr:MULTISPECIES: hypothetical protein [unclassified Leucobacter]PIJ54821.1 hypothetical protein BMH30_01965 [Leucobacter sp. OLES1]PII85353.1 hypothetical protein BMH25_02320 [Leucobacter sp. OLCALW19]PII93133.1 hypothetical protein BMH27_04170 [Leucobacter sp. OLAS13]PII96005.1 hypothetical protein BMH26_01445 [Leucobacter sp. OLTLW20]PII99195.1 hypothetical protein BMH29_05650 [Leucobacter sp. OLDS2]